MNCFQLACQAFIIEIGWGDGKVKSKKNHWDWITENSDAGNQEVKIVMFEGENLFYFDHFKAEITITLWRC